MPSLASLSLRPFSRHPMLSPRFFSFFPWPFSMESVLSQPMWPGKAHGKIGLGLRTGRLLKEVNGKPSNNIEGASYRSAQMVNRLAAAVLAGLFVARGVVLGDENSGCEHRGPEPVFVANGRLRDVRGA